MMTLSGSKAKKLSLLATLFVYFLDYFGIAVVFPIFTPLILRGHFAFISSDTTSLHRWIILATLITSFPLAQIVGAPFFGFIADKKGRKRAFSFTLLGEAFGYAFSAIALWLGSFFLLIFSRMLTGFFAGNLPICLASIADLSKDPKTRGRLFGYLAMTGGFSFITAIAIGGEFSDDKLNPLFNPALPFWILTIVTLLNFSFVRLFYVEPRIGAKNLPLHSSRMKKQSLEIFKSATLRCIYGVFFFLMLAYMPANQFLSAFLIENFASSKQTIVYTFLAAGALWSLANGCINRLLLQEFTSRQILNPSLFAGGASFLIASKAAHLHTFVLFFELAILFASLSWTNCLAIASLNASEKNQGYILGWNQAFGAFAMVLAPFICACIAIYGTREIYLFISAALFISFLLSTFSKNNLKTI